MESVVKNCGQTVHDEVANKQTMEELKELLKVSLLGSRGASGEEGCRRCQALAVGVLLALWQEQHQVWWRPRVSVGVPAPGQPQPGSLGAGPHLPP